MQDVPVKSVKVAELLDDNGRRVLDVTAEGEPTPWDVLGLLLFALVVQVRDLGGPEP